MTTPAPSKADAVRKAARTNDLIDVAIRLATVMNREATLLRQMKVADIAALQGEKATLTDAYERMVREIRSAPDPVHALDPSRLAAVKTASERLDAAANDTAVALKTTAVANEQMFHAIAGAIRDTQSENETYTRDGRLAGAAARQRQQAMAVSVDKTL